MLMSAITPASECMAGLFVGWWVTGEQTLLTGSMSIAVLLLPLSLESRSASPSGSNFSTPDSARVTMSYHDNTKIILM